jgi:hypothetical protein
VGFLFLKRQSLEVIKMAKKTVGNESSENEKSPLIKKTEVLQIPAAKMKQLALTIEGVTPYCHNAFSAEAQDAMRRAQEAGSAGKAKKAHKPKDFEACYQAAIHKSTDGWYGIPCSALRSAMISACRVAGIVMSRAKLTVHVIEDGFDSVDFKGLTRITVGSPSRHDAAVRIKGTYDIRSRPLWQPGWQAVVTIEYDADSITPESVANLLMRAGLQVGIGEGRPDSRDSAGIGWGKFKVV